MNQYLPQLDTRVMLGVGSCIRHSRGPVQRCAGLDQNERNAVVLSALSGTSAVVETLSNTQFGFCT